ncbi:MAG: glutamate-5-semialdehyde dehydrogenase [Candidatus Puniceispirillaceae bacterium]
MTITDLDAYITEMADNARLAQAILGGSDEAQRNQALRLSAALIKERAEAILAANAKDVEKAIQNGLSPAMIDRLTLDDKRLDAMATGLLSIADLPDPVGATLAKWQVPSGLEIARIATALGVIGIIYESRPNVTIDAAGLCIKSGNAAILRGGSDSANSAALLGMAMRDGLAGAGLPQDGVQLVATTDRSAVGHMLTAVGKIDVIVPRGGKSLVERVQNEARVPVFAHLEGICHSYIATGADKQAALDIILNAKMRRTGICGATETVLIDKAIASDILPDLVSALQSAGCEVRGCKQSLSLCPDMVPANHDDWSTEYLDAILSVKIVSDITEAIAHIKQFSSGHTEAIITKDQDAISLFVSAIDSAIIMINASTQFADGGEFGMGAEIGIATGKLHARGPVGAAQLTSFKYVVTGNGHTRP